MLVLFFIPSHFNSSAAFAQDDKPSLAEELPRISHVEPEEALATFKVQHGFSLELVASEPLVSDPVDACFDADGRMYVAEMHGYPFSQEPTRLNPNGGGKKDAGVVRLLEDTDGDGKFERSVKFAEGIRWPTSVCCYDGGVFVLAPPNLHYFKDTDGDDVADIRRVVFTGFDRSNVQSLANNLKWGLDNRIYGAGGRNPSVIKKSDQVLLKLGNSDFALNPVTESVEPVTGGVQFGLSMDDWGNRFVCSNSNHIQHVVYPYQYLGRNPLVSVSGSIRSIAKEGAAAPVYRTSQAEPWRIVRTRRRVSDPNFVRRSSRTEQFAIGFFTSATGVTIYRGDAYPLGFQGNAFIGDVGANMVHRKTVEPNGVSFLAARADEGVEFITSTDNWFRPVNFVNAPDGTLYLLDMYRETIEHPYSIPEDIKAFLKLESGDNRGRIYRIAPPKFANRKADKLSKASSAQLVSQLESTNGWNRETAQRLLWERQDKSVAGPLRKLVTSSKKPLARLHALYALNGLEQLNQSDLLHALNDDEPRVREHAVRLAENHLNNSKELAAALFNLAGDSNQRVGFQLAFTLGEIESEKSAGIIANMIRNPKISSEVRTALLTSSSGRSLQVLQHILEDAEFAKKAQGRNSVAEFARLAGATENLKSLASLLQTQLSENDSLPVQVALLTGLNQGLARQKTNVTKLAATSPELEKLVSQTFSTAAKTATNSSAPLNDRTSAASLLTHAPWELASASLAKLLSPQVPQTLQMAAADALIQSRNKAAAEILLKGWKGHSPQIRASIIDALLQQPTWIDVLFAELATGLVKPGEIARDKQELLTSNRNESIRTRAKKLFGEVSVDRAAIVAKYKSAGEIEGDRERGQQVFGKKCTACHRVGKTGHQVAPNLASVKNKSPADLVISILDPNREAQPNFTTYTVQTIDGRVLTGIIAAETAGSITLRRAEAKEDVVLREDIDVLSSTGKSLMPEGLEKDLNPQQLADVIEFIRTIPADTKK